VGNLDCTFCLDCVQACPHDNIALTTRVPGLELVDAQRRSGMGKLSRRPDVAALVVVFVFGGLLNAFGMVAPVHTLEPWLARALGTTSEAVVLAAIFLVALGIAPLGLLGGAATLTAVLTGGPASSWSRTAASYVYALVPLGFGVWLSHYGFHLLTGALTVIPVTQSAAIDLVGWPVLGAPLWRWTGMQPGAVFPIQLGFLLLGGTGSLGLAYLISERDHPDRAGRAIVPWIAVILILTTAAIWIVSQPMEPRGIGFGG